MPVAVGVALGRENRVLLSKAILLYESKAYGERDAFATVHDVVGVEEGQPSLAPGTLLTVGGLRELHKALYRSSRLEVLPTHVLAHGAHRLSWFEPARERVMFFRSQDSYLTSLSGGLFPQPALLFIAGERQLKVFALEQDERPEASTEVFAAPYYNTSSSGVCLGSMPLPDSLSVHDTRSYSDAFFYSEFTHGTAQRILQGWAGSYGEFWRYVQEQGLFPKQHLVPLGKTVQEVLNA